MSGNPSSVCVTQTAPQVSCVDIDTYGRGFDDVSTLGAGAVGRRIALAHLKESHDARSDLTKDSFVEYDLHGRGDPRVLGTDAPEVNAFQAQENLNRSRCGNRNKKSIREVLFTAKGKVKNAMKRFAGRLSPKGKKSKETAAKVSKSSVSDKPDAKSPGTSTAATSDENASKTRDLTEFEATPIENEESRPASNKAENAAQMDTVGKLRHDSREEAREEEGPSPDIAEVRKSSMASQSSAHELNSESFGEAETIAVESDPFNDIPELLPALRKSKKNFSSAGVPKKEKKARDCFLKAVNYWKRRFASSTAFKESSPNASSPGSASTEQIEGDTSSKSSSSEVARKNETSSEVAEVAEVARFKAELDGLLSQGCLEEQPLNSGTSAANPETRGEPHKGHNDGSQEITVAVVSQTSDDKKAFHNSDQSNDQRKSETGSDVSAAGRVESSSETSGISVPAKGSQVVPTCRDDSQSDDTCAGKDEKNLPDSDGELFFDALESLADSFSSWDDSLSSVAITLPDAPELEGSEQPGGRFGNFRAA